MSTAPASAYIWYGAGNLGTGGVTPFAWRDGCPFAPPDVTAARRCLRYLKDLDKNDLAVRDKLF